MLKNLVVGVVAAGVLSVPLAGVAWADSPTEPGSDGNGIGPGGVPAAVGSQPGLPGTPVPPGRGSDMVTGVSGIAQLPGFGSVPDTIDANTPFGRIGPGAETKVFTPGCGQGNGPSPSGVDCP
jgi:hypothetical protein